MAKRNSEQHRNKMDRKRDLAVLPCGYYFTPAPLSTRSRPMQRFNASITLASINRHTGKPHEHRREIARRLAAA